MNPKADGRAAAEAERKNLDLAALAAGAMHEERAEDVVVLDLRALVDYADYFVIASAASMTQARGAAGAAEKAVVRAGGRRLNRPDRETGWLLVDFGDVLLHVFDRTAREFYRLEDLWGDAPRIDWRRGNMSAGARVPAEEDGHA